MAVTGKRHYRVFPHALVPIALLTALAISPVAGDPNWVVQIPATGTAADQMHSVDAVDTSTAWAVGGCCSNSRILKTTDGGVNWAFQPNPVGGILIGVAAVNVNTAWAVNTDGRIIKTTDGGANWGLQTIVTNLQGVAAVDANSAWAVGFNGAIFHTGDGGTTWSAQSSGSSQLLTAVTAVTTNFAWAVGANGTILHTSDGGTTWSAQSSGTSQFLTAVTAVTTNIAWAVGNGNTILKTTDGGTTWTPQNTTGALLNFNGVAAIDADTAWAVGIGIVQTTDGGTTWTQQTRPGGGGTLTDVTAVDTDTAWAVGSFGEIIKVNSAPTADAGPDQAVILVGSTVNLDGTGSFDPTGDPITFAWFFDSRPAGSVASFSDPTSATPTFVADVNGDYIARLTVTDAFGASSSDTVLLSFDNLPPVADAGDDQIVSIGDAVVLDGTASFDVEDPFDQLSLSWKAVGRFISLTGADTATPSFIAPGSVVTFTFLLTVTDTDGNASTDVVLVTVLEDLNNAIFVSKSLGSDSNSGSRGFPVQSLKRASALANANLSAGSPRADIYVHADDYLEAGPFRSLVGLTLRDDMSLYGGFDAFRPNPFAKVQGWTRTATTPTRLDFAQAAIGLQVLAITSPTTIDGLSIFASDGRDGEFFVSGAGENSFAIYARIATDALQITNNKLFAGKGGEGVRGQDGVGTGDSPVPFGGGGGGGGEPGLQNTFSNLGLHPVKVLEQLEARKLLGIITVNGGAGGHNIQRFCLPGGRGGHAFYGVDGGDGADGVGPDPGFGGPGGLKTGPLCDNNQCEGLAGTRGGDGAPGGGGPGGPGDGEIVRHVWRGSAGQPGVSGQNASGGGGGGAGAGRLFNFQAVSGASGGGGGGGGCGALPGLPGGGGGGSVGVFLSDASPIIDGNEIFTAGGGRGGRGGNGKIGGPSGDFGIGGFVQTGSRDEEFVDTGAGGDGGLGGRGGSSGGGGGGGGGVSCRFMLIDESRPLLGFNPGMTGPSGLGGTGGTGGPGASDGQAGEVGFDCSPITAIRVPDTRIFQQSTGLLSFQIIQMIGQATISSSWDGSDVVMTLVTPTGRIIDRDTTDPDVVHHNGATFEVYGITDPEVGDWTIELFGADVPDTGEDVTVGITTVPANQPPVADAGPDQSVEAMSPVGASVALRGAGSTDPDGDALSFEWSDSGNNIVGTIAQLSLTLPLGTHTFALTVNDGRGGTDTDSATVTVEDTVPPIIGSMTANPNVLSPPYHKMVPITVSASVSDFADAAPSCRIILVRSNESIDSDWEITGDLAVNLRAERAGDGAGRIYLVTIECTDGSGNSSADIATVIVSHDQR